MKVAWMTMAWLYACSPSGEVGSGSGSVTDGGPASTTPAQPWGLGPTQLLPQLVHPPGTILTIVPYDRPDSEQGPYTLDVVLPSPGPDEERILYVAMRQYLVQTPLSHPEDFVFLSTAESCSKLDMPSTAVFNLTLEALDSGELGVAGTGGCVQALDTGTGAIRVLAGDTGFGSWPASTGVPAVGSELDAISSIVEADDGTLFIAEQSNFVVWEIVDGLLNAVVGVPGMPGYSGDGGPGNEALIGGPLDLGGAATRMAVDGRTLYVADACNHVVRAYDRDTGIVQHVAGNPPPRESDFCSTIWRLPGGYSGDGGPASEAELDYPSDVAVCNGVLYIADTENHCVRRVGADGIISTVAGVCTIAGYAGDGGPATEAFLNGPSGVACGLDGDLLIADMWNTVIRRVVRPEDVEAPP